MIYSSSLLTTGDYYYLQQWRTSQLCWWYSSSSLPSWGHSFSWASLPSKWRTVHCCYLIFLVSFGFCPYHFHIFIVVMFHTIQLMNADLCHCLPTLSWRCNDPTVSGIETCVGNFTDPATGMVEDRVWTTDWPNFDNVGNSLVVCFLVATLNGYTQTMMEVCIGFRI